MGKPINNQAAKRRGSVPASGGSNMSDRRNNMPLMAVICVAIAAFVIYICYESYDNDIWFLLATGREIVEGGIPRTNVFAAHEGMQTVIQQWLPCVIDYGVYTLGETVGIGGFAALAVLLAAMTGLLALSMYRLGRLLKRDTFGGELVLMAVLLCLMGVSLYLTMRPHVYTMIAFCWVVFFCAKYRLANDTRLLVALPLICLVHINFHMAMAPFDLAIIACFLIPDFVRPLHRRGKLGKVGLSWASYRRVPLLVAFGASALALLANPYGVRGALYLLLSYGAAGYRNFISEMGPLRPGESWLMVAGVAMAVLAVLVIGRRGPRRIDLPLTLLALGCTVLAFVHTRNLWMMPLFCLPIVCEGMHGWSLARKSAARGARTSTRTIVATWAIGAVGTAAFLVGLALVLPNVEREAADAEAPIVKMLQAIEESEAAKAEEAAADPNDASEHEETVESSQLQPSQPKILSDFGEGGMLEWNGYKTYIDPRPELWSPGITGLDKDYYREYIDMLKGDIPINVYLRNYGFDYVMTDYSDVNAYLKGSPDWENVMGTGKYELWRRVEE